MPDGNSRDAHCFQQIHVDAAQNSTDDFNPFHEPRKCGRIRGNPYPGAIVLGFQLEQLLEHEVDIHRDLHGERDFIAQHGLHYSNYQLTFADALLPGEPFGIEIKHTIPHTDIPSLANRVLIRKDTGVVMTGHKRETTEPLYLRDRSFAALPDLRAAADRGFVPGTLCFLKRKYMNTGNAKNFVAGSLCDQGYYFDELEDRVHFPEMFPVALLSCALLEKAMKERHDFMTDPMVYMSHRISVDRRVNRRVRSNDVLHILIEGPDDVVSEAGLGKSGIARVAFRAFGVVSDGQTLYRAEVEMAPLQSIVGARRSAL
jgi:hypothetical protein